MPNYIPQKGDFIYLSFDPQAGHEQKGRRTALVVSNNSFNKGTGLAMVCPVTNIDRKIPFHLFIPETLLLTGFVMVEQVKSYDYRARKATFIEKAPEELLEDALAILDICLK
jgi:mRNA interferase MazF